MPRIVSARISEEMFSQVEALRNSLGIERGDLITLALRGYLSTHNHTTGGARKADPDTSKAAAKSLDANRVERIVLDAISISENGSTVDEIAARLPQLPMNTISARIAPLCRKGYVIDTEERRKGRSNKNQRVIRRIK